MTHSPDHAERAREVLAKRLDASSLTYTANVLRIAETGEELLVDWEDALAAMEAYADERVAAALRGRDRDRVVEAAQFLSDRLDDLEWMDGELESTCRDYMGHVDPAHARLRAALHDAKVMREGEGE